MTRLNTEENIDCKAKILIFGTGYIKYSENKFVIYGKLNESPSISKGKENTVTVRLYFYFIENYSNGKSTSKLTLRLSSATKSRLAVKRVLVKKH